MLNEELYKDLTARIDEGYPILSRLVDGDIVWSEAVQLCIEGSFTLLVLTDQAAVPLTPGAADVGALAGRSKEKARTRHRTG